MDAFGNFDDNDGNQDNGGLNFDNNEGAVVLVQKMQRK